MNDKWKSVILSAIIAVIFISSTFLVFAFDLNILGELMIYIDIFACIFFICSFFNRYKKVIYQAHMIEVYAGFFIHYIKVNGNTKDEYKGFSYSPIELKCKINDKEIEVVISLTNHIKLKIDGELIK